MFVQAALTASLFLAPQPDVLLVTEARGYVHDSIPAARAAIRALEPEIDVREVPRSRAHVPPRSAPPTRSCSPTATASCRSTAPRCAGSSAAAAGWRASTRRAGCSTTGRAGSRCSAGASTTTGRPARSSACACAAHPATRGVPARFSLPEEFYVHQPGVERRTRVLARWGAARRPLVWVRTPGRGRVFYDALGHFTATWSDPRQRALVRSGLRWVLRLD